MTFSCIGQSVSIILVIFFGINEGTKFLEEHKPHVRMLIDAWTQNPNVFPNRISGTLVSSLKSINQHKRMPDFLLWDPLTEYQLELTCPRCLITFESNSLYPARWKDGKSPCDEPRKLYCIQREVFLVSRIYRCQTGHQTLAHDPWTLKAIPSFIQVPFVLFHKSGVTRDFFQSVFTHVQAGAKLTDIEHFLQQMYHDAVITAARTATHDVVNNLALTSIETPGRRIVKLFCPIVFRKRTHVHTAYVRYTLQVAFV